MTHHFSHQVVVNEAVDARRKEFQRKLLELDQAQAMLRSISEGNDIVVNKAMDARRKEIQMKLLELDQAQANLRSTSEDNKKKKKHKTIESCKQQETPKHSPVLTQRRREIKEQQKKT